MGAGLTCAKCSCVAVISGSSVQSDSQAAETTGGELLIVAFWPKHDLSLSNFKNSKIFLVEHAPRLP